MRKLFTALCAVLFVFGTVRLAGATLEFYSDRGTFNAANPDLPVENFEEGNFPPGSGGLAVVPAPLDSSSNNGFFSPGAILDGVRFQDNPSSDIIPFGFVLIGSDYLFLPMPSKTLFTNTFADTLDIFFDGSGVAAVGMDVFGFIFPSQVVISIYGEGGLLGSSSVDALSDGTPIFWGVFSDAELITRINLASTAGLEDQPKDQMEGIDNIAFGTPVQEISTLLLDIKPGSYPNSINLKSKGVVPVAILTTDDFDASNVDPDTCVFAGANPLRWKMEDVDNDGDYDILFHCRTQDLLNLNADSTEASLEGETDDGRQIIGTDSVNIVPKGKGYGKKKGKK